MMRTNIGCCRWQNAITVMAVGAFAFSLASLSASAEEIRKDSKQSVNGSMSTSDVAPAGQSVLQGDSNPVLEGDAGLLGDEERVGGDTCANAVIITPAMIPYSDTGATNAFVNDLNDSCAGYTNNAPDVVYRFTPTVDGLLSVTLCNDATNYDSGLYIYENICNTANLHTCNDDACTTAGFPVNPWVSQLTNVVVLAGNNYFIVVDGTVGGAGNYDIDVNFTAGTCDVACVGTAENEPNCGQPADTVNGGCNSASPVFSTAVSGVPNCGTGLFNGATRDTDWYRITTATPTVITQSIEAEFQVVIGLIFDGGEQPPMCPVAGGISPFAVLGPCTPGSITTTCLPAGTWTFFVGADFGGPTFACGAEYEMTITAAPCPQGACCLPNGTCMDNVGLLQCEEVLLGRHQGNGTLCSGVSCPISGCTTSTLVGCNSTTVATLVANNGVSLPTITCATGPDDGNNPRWYRFVATGDSAEVQTCNSGIGQDSVLAAYSGTCPGGLVEVACDDDSCGTSGFNSRLCFPTVMGNTYYVQIAAWDNTAASQGAYDLEVNCPCPDLEPQACCDDALGTCTDETPDNCTGPTQRPGGVGTTCATILWTPPCGSGACCSALAGGCVPDQTEADCFNIFGGTNWFPGQTCAPDPCIGACCVNGSCVGNNTEAVCDGLGGDNWYPGLSCTGAAPPVCNLPDMCLWDNGNRLEDFGAAAAQVAPDFPFVAESADDFTLKFDGEPTNPCLITEVTATFSYFNLAARPDPAAQWGGIWVTIYGDAGTPKGPDGMMEANNTPAAGSVIIGRQFVAIGNVTVTDVGPVCTDPVGVCCTGGTCVDGTTGSITEDACVSGGGTYFGDFRLGLSCADIDPITAGAQPANCAVPNVVAGLNDRDTYEVVVPVSLPVAKNTKYWLAVQPEMDFTGNGQLAWALSVNNTDHPAQQRFPAAGIVDWQEIGGNGAAADCAPTPPLGAATGLAFRLDGIKGGFTQELISWSSCGNHGGTVRCKAPGSECDVEGRSCAGLFSVDMSGPTTSASASIDCGGGSVACTVVNGDPLIVDCSPLSNGTCTVTLGGDALGSFTLRVLNGDVDKNGTVNAADITAIKPFLGQPASANMNADMDCNGSINAADITYIKPRLGSSATACP